MSDLSKLSTAELLALHAGIASELRERNVTRSSNNPVGDYAEHLFSKAMGWTLANNSTGSFDALDGDGKRYQIKSRRLTKHNGSTLLGVMRDLPKAGFDSLAAVLFDETYKVVRAVLIPHQVLEPECRYSSHQRGWLLTLRPSHLLLPGARDVTDILTRAQSNI